MAPPLLTLQDITLGFGGRPLFRGVSLAIGAGERLCLVGRNGAGKSTLLKILAKITEPTRGRVEIRGRTGALLEVGTGFHLDFTGRENVILHGILAGHSRAEVRRALGEICEFAELGDAIDSPVRTYSTGMGMRLGFAAALGFALAEMAVVYPVAGAFGTYADVYLGPFAGFATRLSYWFAETFAIGAMVTAVDRSARRLERLKGNLARTRLSAEVVEADAAAYDAPEPFDAVLLDAPCSATGTLRRRPDVAWNKTEKDVRAMSAAQTRLIGAAARALKPGGRLVFCTCSLQPEEGPDALAAALEDGAPLAVDPINIDEIPGLPSQALQTDGTLRTLPSFWAETGGMDGFFVARLTRPG